MIQWHKGYTPVVRCGQCKHWQTDDRLVSVSLTGGEGVCEKVSGKAHGSGPDAYVTFGYELVTRDKFGCTIGEPK